MLMKEFGELARLRFVELARIDLGVWFLWHRGDFSSGLRLGWCMEFVPQAGMALVASFWTQLCSLLVERDLTGSE